MTAPLFAYDGAYSPDLATCKAHGAIAMMHYLTGRFAATSAQPHAIRAAGMGAVLNWEVAIDALVGVSRVRGQAIGRDALDAVDADCPRDGSVGIYFSVDTDVPENALGACDAGFAGVNDVVRPAGLQVKTYAEMGLLLHLVGRGLVQGKQWLLMSEGFSPPGSYQPWSPHVCAVQMHDAAGNWIGTDLLGTDRNTVTDPYALGAWWNPGSPYTQGDLPMTPAEQTALAKEIAAETADAVWAHNLAGTSNHTAAYWETNINALEAQILAAVKGWTGVTLTAADVTAIATEVAAKLPTYLLTPTATP